MPETPIKSPFLKSCGFNVLARIVLLSSRTSKVTFSFLVVEEDILTISFPLILFTLAEPFIPPVSVLSNLTLSPTRY